MTRSRPPSPDAPCSTCGVPHEPTNARGWRAEDGHPYRPTSPHPPLHSVAAPHSGPERPTAVQATNPAPPDYDVLFGLWAFCKACGAGVANTDAGMAAHRHRDAELEQLRVDVDRLTRIVNRGGGAA